MSSGKAPLIQISSGGSFVVGAGVTIDCDTSGTYYAYWYMYGHTSLQGTSAKPIIIKHYYRLRVMNREGNTPHDWDYVELQLPYSTSADGLSFRYDTDTRLAHSFSNIKVNNRTNSGYICVFESGDWSDVTFDNWYTEDTGYGILSNGANFKFTNSTFKQVYYYNYIYGNYGESNYSNSFDPNDKDVRGQSKIIFDNCIFEDNNEGVRGFYFSAQSVIKFMDCTFQGVNSTLTYGLTSYYNSKILHYGTNTFTNVSINKYWSTNGQHLHVRELDLTVYDTDGTTVLNDAVVTVKQKQGKEFWMFKTDSNGKILDIFEDNPVFVEKEETSLGNFTNWSNDISSGVCHVIVITKEGYQPWIREVEFTQDLTISVTLKPADQSVNLPISY